MAQFDVYALGDGLVVDCQSDFLDHLQTRLVIPLVHPEIVPQALGRLHPTFTVDDQTVLLATHLAGAVQTADLGPKIGSLDAQYLRVTNAIDFLIGGV